VLTKLNQVSIDYIDSPATKDMEGQCEAFTYGILYACMVHFSEVSKIDEINDFMVFHQYPDEPTMRLVASVAKVAGKAVHVDI